MIYDIYVDANQQTHVVFTDRGGNGNRIDKPIGSPLDYITGLTYSADGTVWVDFAVRSSYKVPRKWQVIDRMYINTDNKLVIEYNTFEADGVTHETDVIDYVIKTIESAYVDSDTQELIIKYRVKSTGVEADDFVIESVSDPLNTIAETALDDRCHLLIYYSSSIIRAALTNKATWQGKNDWCDLGYVRGEPGGIHIIGDLPYISDLPAGGPPVGYEGWVYTVTDSSTNVAIIYAWNYQNPAKGWYPIGSIDSSALKPETIVMAATRSASDPNMPADDTLNENGLWFIITK